MNSMAQVGLHRAKNSEHKNDQNWTGVNSFQDGGINTIYMDNQIHWNLDKENNNE